jgi:hypothetical protein
MQGPLSLGSVLASGASVADTPPVRRTDGPPIRGRPPRSLPQAAGTTHRDRDRLARSLAIASWRLVPALARAARSFVENEGWVPFGYSRLSEFARGQLHRSARWCRDLGALGVGLDRFPLLEQALTGDDGGRPLGRVAALCIARTASESTLDDWLCAARRLTVRELLEVARDVRRAGGDSPPVTLVHSEQDDTDVVTPGADVTNGRSAGDGANVFHFRVEAPPEESSGCDANVFHPKEPAPDPACQDGAANVFQSHDETGEEGASSRANTSFEPTLRVEEEDDTDVLSEACLALPEPVDIALDEVLDLYRAVSGGEATVTSFVEALLGEAAAGPHPPDAELVTMRPGANRAARERALERANMRWQELEGLEAMPLREPDTEILASLEVQVVQVLGRVARLGAEAGHGELGTVVRQLVELVRLEHVIERLMGRLLRTMGRHGDWTQLGFSGAGHYAEERLGMSRRTAESRAGIEGALRSLPEVRRAYEDDRLGLEAAWVLSRVLGRGPIDPATESSWVEIAVECGIKRVRDEARRARLLRYLAPEQVLPPAIGSATCEVLPDSGDCEELSLGDVQNVREPDLEDDPLDLDSIPTSLFELRASRRVCWIRRNPPPAADDDEWFKSLRRWPGMTWERVWRLGRRALSEPGAAVQRRFRLPEDLARAFLSTVESERRRLESMTTDEWTEREPEASRPPSILATHEYAKRLRRVPSWVALLSMLEDFARTWDDPRAIPRRKWYETYEEANYRCMAPGCLSRAKIQDHHIDYRSEGGSDELWNQLALCSFHHLQGEHGQFAEVRGTAPLDVTWRLGLEGFASWWKNERRLDAPEAAALLAAVAREHQGEEVEAGMRALRDSR